MSFYTSLTGLNAATTQLGVTSNNIANVATTGFKRSRADFGDIFATSPLQKATSVVGKGTALKQVSQEFSQGNIELSGNTLDLAVTGEGFFPMKSGDGQNLYTRNGSFLLDDKNRVANSAGQLLMVAKVDSLGKADFDSDLQALQIQTSTVGEAVATSAIDLSINFPADAPVATITNDDGDEVPKEFNPADPTSYAKSSAVTVFDDNGNDYLATIYYARTQVASADAPSNKWQTHVFLGEQQIEPALSQATSPLGEPLYVNKYGQIEEESNIPVQLRSTNATYQKFNLDDLTNSQESTAASVPEQPATLQLPYQTSLGPVTLSAETAGLTLAADWSSYSEDSPTAYTTHTLTLDDLSPTERKEQYSHVAAANGDQTYLEMKQAEFDLLDDESKLQYLLDRQFLNDLEEAFTVVIDVPAEVDSNNITEYELQADLSNLLNGVTSFPYTGKNLAEEMTRELNRQFGAESYFDLADENSDFGVFTLTSEAVSGAGSALEIDVDVASALTAAEQASLTQERFASEIQKQLNTAAYAAAVSAAEAAGSDSITDYYFPYTVEYSRGGKGFQISRSDNSALTMEATVAADGTATTNELFGLTNTRSRAIDPNNGFFNEASAYDVVPNGDNILAAEYQRFGLKVVYDESANNFTLASGSTGDDSNIAMYSVSQSVQELFGFATDKQTFLEADLKVESVESTELAERGVVSLPAKVKGNPLSVNIDSVFDVTALTNEFSVTVNDVTETFSIPTGAYNLNDFIATLERRINSMGDAAGRTVSGVSIEYDAAAQSLRFETGTTGDEAFLQIAGSSKWGLADLPPGLGSTSTWIQPATFSDARGLNAEVFVRFNNETNRWEEYSASPDLGMLELSDSQTFELASQPEYRPLFLDKGELTFDTSGNLVSPLTGIELDNVVIGSSGNTLQIDIDYAGSTQFAGEFSVNAQSQNGLPNGSLVGLDVADDGLVTASYSNGTQDLKGKIILANFSTPNGLRQLGDSTFLESSESGAVSLGEPGTAGFGSIRAGARERANLDLTTELVDLITAQRNFQANAKGLETSSTLTSTIINIRS